MPMQKYSWTSKIKEVSKMPPLGYKKVKATYNSWEAVRRAQEDYEVQYKTMIVNRRGSKNYYLYIKRKF